MSEKDWKFKDEDRDKVCKGEMCPKCLGNDIIVAGYTPDGLHLNIMYDCNSCKEQWEGY